MSDVASRSTRWFQGLLVLGCFSAILVEWAQYASHVSRLSYVLLVPLLAGVLALVPGEDSARDPASRERLLGRRLSTLLLLGAALLLALGSLSSVFTLSITAFPLALLALAISWAGWPAVRSRPWAALLLFGMVPLPMPILDQINPWLTRASGQVAVTLIRPFDAEASWIGSDLTFRDWTLEVAEACSGSGTFLIFLVLGVFLAGLFRFRLRGLLLLLAIAPPLTLLVNGVRIGGTALLLERFGRAAGEGLIHELFGQGVVIVAAALLVWGGTAAAARSRRAQPGESR
jgi:exosortase